MLVVTYDFGTARRLADRTPVVDDGRIVKRDDTTVLLEDLETEPARTLVESAFTTNL
jgi:ABC-type glutathione transport system ATPase component